jgi:BirA family biotin operon repressor/biotin-[acetyl-CoA-carboxylase] ligase
VASLTAYLSHVSALDPSLVAARMYALGGSWPEPVVMDSVESTNAVLAHLPGDSDGACVVADEQTAGRGRLDRTWTSNAGAGLWMSVRVSLAGVPSERWPLLTMAAALAAQRGLIAACDVPARIKWPNDLVVGTRKIGGLLTEVVGSVAIVGIGINVDWPAEQLPTPEATSVLVEGGRTDREELLAHILVLLEGLLPEWREGRGDLVADFRAVCSTVGREVAVHLPGGGTLTGIASDIDDRGHLVVQDRGTPVSVSAGDVIHATITPWDIRPSSSPPAK